ncbi:hypothetical protein [Floridanema aerugineum]|uniref:Uncharacterized protein n=1 Tax=Floridaenema aerugineum BLCC-F46 TaxID=3153654 RepID=A0ABV4X238_9CYAN
MQDSAGKTISYHLGYLDDNLEPTVSASRQPLVLNIMENINAVENALNSAVLDSMALQVGDLKVDYATHISQLKNQGTMLLIQLSQLTGLPIAFDKFQLSAGNTGGNGGNGSVYGQSLVIQSYW